MVPQKAMTYDYCERSDSNDEIMVETYDQEELYLSTSGNYPQIKIMMDQVEPTDVLKIIVS